MVDDSGTGPARTARLAPVQGWNSDRPIAASVLSPRAKGISGKVRGKSKVAQH
jgi:hypothetical protein